MDSNEINVFVDGSYRENVMTASIGVVVARKRKIVAEQYQEYINAGENVHELIAMLNGLQLVNEMDDCEIVNIFSDDRGLVRQVNKYLIKQERVISQCFANELYEIIEKLVSKGCVIKVHWVKDSWTYGLKRAHLISRKWAGVTKLLESKEEYIYLIKEIEKYFPKINNEKRIHSNKIAQKNLTVCNSDVYCVGNEGQKISFSFGKFLKNY